MVTDRNGRPRGRLWKALVFLIIVGGIVWLIISRLHQMGPMTHASGRRFNRIGPMPVSAATAYKGDVGITLDELGTVTPLATVTVKTQIAGQLIRVAFQEGQLVRAGDFLAQVDPRPYEWTLMQLQGQLQRDQALLQDAQTDLARYATLVAQDSIAKQQLDTQRAVVEQDKGIVKMDQAQIGTAKLNIVYCHIIAPVGGRVGLRQVDPGNYVQTSDTNGIVIITRLQPISVIFPVPEDNLPAVMERLHSWATLPVTVFDRSGSNKLATGHLLTVDNEIDPTTGTAKMRAIFDNRDNILFPDQFVNVKLLVNTLHGVTIVPTSAIQRGAPGTFVYVIKPNHIVTVQVVKLGPTSGNNIGILAGLIPGELVVSDGADKLKEGEKVVIPGEKGLARAVYGNKGNQPYSQERQFGQHHHQQESSQ